MAREIAISCAILGGALGEHDYLPTTAAKAIGWEPHKWVIDGITRGLETGRRRAVTDDMITAALTAYDAAAPEGIEGAVYPAMRAALTAAMQPDRFQLIEDAAFATHPGSEVNFDLNIDAIDEAMDPARHPDDNTTD